MVFPVCTSVGKLNLACVRIRFKLGGWHLQLINLTPSNALFIFGLAFYRVSVSLMILKMFGFLGLYVDTNVRNLLLSLAGSFCCRHCCFGTVFVR